MSALEQEPDDDGRQELERRIRVAYATAMRHTHEGGTIQVHAGPDVIDYFKSLMPQHPRHPLLNNLIRPQAFGFPIVPAAEHQGPDHLSIHVVHYVF